jgi:diguanylate cyclase (GGDEF)-like protein
MDSALLGHDNFLNYTIGEGRSVKNEFTDPVFLSAVNKYLTSIDGYFDLESETSVMELTKGKYRYATIAPIVGSTWSVVTFYDASSLFGVDKFFPIIIIVLTMFIAFVFVTGFASNKIIFEPFEKLTYSISCIKGKENEIVYGIDRDDEVGDIANTVQDMKDSLIEALNKAHYDALTGIYNRRFLEENMSQTIKSLSRSGGVLSVMMCDVDFFKNYNDTYGHSMGDTCLKIIASTLVNSISRAEDFVARYGGEEFAIILPNTDASGAMILADKLLENIRACQIPHSNSSIANHVTISIGVTTGNVVHSQNGTHYIKKADKALYMSKTNGRNRYTFLDLDKPDK